MPMRTIAYLRVSTGRQDLAQQKLAILDYARKHRIAVDDVVEVHGSTRTAPQRTQLLELIETLQPGDRLMVSELSRLGRSLRPAPTLYAALEPPLAWRQCGERRART
jgi:DNA invertase Pin-like site-specific DNA recombinase